jgi:NADP-dependent 3-hydroxy acid dehydrogenase YdfG
VVAFSEALRQEVSQQNIRVTVIEPGLVATEIQEHITDQAAKEQIQAQMHVVTPLASEDIAAAIVYAVIVPQHVSINEMLIRPTKEI